MPEICVLVGTVGSGKSTYAKQQARDGWVIVNDDSIVNAVHADQYTLYDEKLKPLYKGVELFVANTALAMGKSVVVDKGLNLSRNARQRWVSFGRSLDLDVQCILFEFFTPEIHAARRTESDARGISYESWLRRVRVHFSMYEEPTVEEGFASIVTQAWN